jgi:hypothetical protein
VSLCRFSCATSAGRETNSKTKKGTEVSTPMVTKGSDHSGPSVTNKILSNDMALKRNKR